MSAGSAETTMKPASAQRGVLLSRAPRSVDQSTPIAVAPQGYEHCPGLGAADVLNDPSGQLVYAMNWP